MSWEVFFPWVLLSCLELVLALELVLVWELVLYLELVFALELVLALAPMLALEVVVAWELEMERTFLPQTKMSVILKMIIDVPNLCRSTST